MYTHNLYNDRRFVGDLEKNWRSFPKEQTTINLYSPIIVFHLNLLSMVKSTEYQHRCENRNKKKSVSVQGKTKKGGEMKTYTHNEHTLTTLADERNTKFFPNFQRQHWVRRVKEFRLVVHASQVAGWKGSCCWPTPSLKALFGLAAARQCAGRGRGQGMRDTHGHEKPVPHLKRREERGCGPEFWFHTGRWTDGRGGIYIPHAD